MTLLTTLASAIGTLGAPDVTILSATNVKAFSATLRGQIDNNHGADVTEIFFEWGYISGTYEQSITLTAGSPYSGIVSTNIDGLSEYETYYYRFYAKNSSGTTYSPEYYFTTIASTYSVVIGGIDRTGDILTNSLGVDDQINDQQNTARLALIDNSGNGIPETDDEIVVTMLDGTKIFGGYIVGSSLAKDEAGVVIAQFDCVDYSRLLDGVLVHRSYTNQTDAEIIADIISRYLPDAGITTTNVITGVTIDQINFNYVQPSQAIRRIAELAARYWYIDYDKDIHYFPLTTTASPFNITDTSVGYSNLQINKDASQLKNRVYVRGGTKLSDATSYSTKGDGVMIKFVLPDKPHNLTLTVNGAAKTVGIKNIDTTGYDWYLNFQEKYVEQDAGGGVLATTDTLAVAYQYDIPILIALEDTASIAASGIKEHAIFDSSIATTEAARARATAELTDYANQLIEGSFKTYTHGFRSGQCINVTLTDYGISADYIVQSVSATSMAAGMYEYQVKIASAKTLGIIRFLIDLLEADRGRVAVSDDEVVDELFSLTDSLSGAITDSLTIDSAGQYATWCSDSLQSTPTTRAIWNLFQWGA